MKRYGPSNTVRYHCSTSEINRLYARIRLFEYYTKLCCIVVLSYAPHLQRLHEVAWFYPHSVSAEGAAEILLRDVTARTEGVELTEERGVGPPARR